MLLSHGLCVWVQVVSVQAYGAFVRLDGHDLDG